jgi:predicted nucleic acid-binding protein
MRLYIDLNCFNRPFDDQTQERIRRETEAVYAILQRIMQGEDMLLWSWVMTYENDQHPKLERRDEISLWEHRAVRSVGVDTSLQERARLFTQHGIPTLDAAHLASAEAGEADVMLTCDDALLRRAQRFTLALRVMNPVAYFELEIADG